MSDPTFWTPPCSPKFVGESFGAVDDLANDLFQDEVFSGELETLIGLSCDTFDLWNILRFFESPPKLHFDIDVTTSFGLLWSRFQVLMMDQSSEEESPSLKSARNDISFLLLSLLKAVPSDRDDESFLVHVTSHLRSLLIYVFGTDIHMSHSVHLFHAQIELWIISMKLLEYHCSDERDTRTLNACFGLEPSSVLDAYGYFMDVLLDRTIHLHSTNTERTNCCQCIDAIWILLVRYTEKFQSGWFKHLHGKITKLLSSNKITHHEPTSFERLRPNPVVQHDPKLRPEFQNSDQTAIWLVYWSLLASTASVHKTYMKFSLQNEVSPANLQKYSIVIWLVRKLFLGELLPSDKNVQVYLNCLLNLFAIWGPNLEVIRSLWIYFARRLDYGLALASEGRTACYQDTRFATWFNDLCKLPQSDPSAFNIFCHLLRQIPISEFPELMSIVKVSLPTLTRQGAMRYLTLFGHLFCETLENLSESAAAVNIHGFTSLVNALSENCLASSSPEALHNWDVGRRCTTLHGIQLLSLLCRRCCLRSDIKGIFSRLLDGTRQLAAIQNLLRQSVLESIKLSDSDAGSSRLSVMGWRSELAELSVRFGCELTEFDEAHLVEIGYPLVTLVTLFLDRSFFQSVSGLNDSDWIVFLKRLFILANHSDQSSTQIRNYLWSDVFPVLQGRVSRSRDQSHLFSHNLAQNLADLALHFIKMCTNVNGASDPDYKRAMTLFEFFSTDASVDPAVRFAFCEACFATRTALKTTLSLFEAELSSNLETVWRFFTVWLIYGLFVRPTADDRADNQLGSCLQLTSVDSEILAFFPPDMAVLFNEVDPEYTLISIAAKFDLCKNFHERMAYKSLASGHLGRVCDMLCDLFSVCSVSDDQETGLDATHIANCSRESLCSIGFRAASLLVRHCAILLYTPVAAGSTESSFERVITAFVLPRQLYELSKWKSTTHVRTSERTLSPLVIECMRDKLPEFIHGFSQLSWRSDAYVTRIIRDSVRLYYQHLGGTCVAMAVLNSPSDFRIHLLHLVSQEALSEIDMNAPESDGRVQAVVKWLAFGKQVHRDTRSAEAHQRDAPFIVWPLLNAITSSSFGERARSDVKQDAHKLMSVYKQATKNVKTVELREEIRRHCEGLQQKNAIGKNDLIRFFEI